MIRSPACDAKQPVPRRRNGMRGTFYFERFFSGTAFGPRLVRSMLRRGLLLLILVFLTSVGASAQPRIVEPHADVLEHERGDGASGPDSTDKAASEMAPVEGNPADPVAQLRAKADEFVSQRLRLDVGDRVFFPPGSAALGGRARVAIARQAAWLMATDVDVLILGHADDGDPRRDAALSTERADAVMKRLVAEGVPAVRLRAFGVGRQEPVADCASPLCRAQNRRAVILILRRGALGS